MCPQHHLNSISHQRRTLSQFVVLTIVYTTMDAQDASKSSTTEPAPKPAQPKSLRTIYLIFYNYVSALLWFATLVGVTILVPYGGFRSVYPGVGQFTKWTQTLALLEVVHAAIGRIRAPAPTPNPTKSY